jgi:hypothetical protein
MLTVGVNQTGLPGSPHRLSISYRRDSERNMNVLLVYPEWPNTYWSFKHALLFQGKRSSYPPLGLLTIAALLPTHWAKRLVDTNVRALKESDLAWADSRTG